jgi:hypothetical protein
MSPDDGVQSPKQGLLEATETDFGRDFFPTTSEMGHKRTGQLQFVMSALPPQADIHCGAANVRFGPFETHAVQQIP